MFGYIALDIIQVKAQFVSIMIHIHIALKSVVMGDFAWDRQKVMMNLLTTVSVKSSREGWD
jgi:hypothetical protein